MTIQREADAMNKGAWCAAFGASLLAIAGTLAGCMTDGSNSDVKFVPTGAEAGMSLAAAKRTIQYEARKYHSDGAADHKQEAVHFEPTQWLFTYYDPSTNKKGVYGGCEYEKYEPDIYKYLAGDRFSVFPKKNGPCTLPSFAIFSEARAQDVATAMQRWRISTPEERAAFFAAETSVTPAMVDSYARVRASQAIPEEARRYRVLADAAIREKRFPDAANAYEDALDVAPWWGQGHFNAALVLAEIYYYRDAINHMRKYLALTPGASDARQVQDKIYEWENVLRSKT